MRLVSTFLGVALASVVAACTVTTGGGFDEDDDLMFGEKPRWDPEDTDETTSEPATPDAGTSTGETTTDETTEETTESPDGGTDTTDSTETTEETTTEPDAGGGNGGMCALETVEDDCDACLIYSCIEQVEACCGSDCAGQWATVKSCMAGEPDPLMTREDQLEECTLEAAAEGQDSSLDSALFDLRNCIESSFEGDWEDDPFERQPGDGTCTYVCYGTYVIGDPED